VFLPAKEMLAMSQHRYSIESLKARGRCNSIF
jgi:hypothetical protein